ncbi:hypothetical protein AUH73_05120 [archaeon 13_1_40CM_4_53_4]|nr:MAG: hypothetical protein AUI07_08010 [archaeon 13_2_20CM_2_53_6]OLC62248.1 MAG: hypothetical protein AUH73_05120 [archaeon 13_1_40CM_4_53_4]OLE59116.1 MAG: hypothetical protein AUG17_04060 [Crenarchaeota archaeon 13_1_20CM_2_53_14]TMI26888.1 MAG: hypothetical protein E6H24_02125 [Candidatus Bathyarchaeota archaeon]
MGPTLSEQASTVGTPLPLDFLVFITITVLTFTLLLVNYVGYLSRGYRYGAFYELGALVFGGLLIGALLGPVMVGLGASYGTSVLLSRWGFTFGWAFMLTLAGACASIYERHLQSRISVTLNVVATILLGFALVAGLLFSGGTLPALPTSIVNLGLAALFTSFLKLLFEKRKEKGRKGLRQRLADLFKR